MTNFPLLFVCVLATVPVGTAVHEAGHWVAGRLVGVPIREVRIGGGEEIASFLLGPTLVDLRWGPWSGRVSPYPYMALAPWRAAVFCAGGSVASLALIGAAVAVLWALPGSGQFLQTLIVAVLLNTLWGACQILPWLPWESRGRDYHLIRDALRDRGGADPDVDWAAKVYGAGVADRYGAAGAAGPSRHAPLVIHAISGGSPRSASGSMVPSGGRGPAAEAFRRWLLSRRGLSAPERAALLDGLATGALLGEFAVPHSDLDAWTAELVALAPEVSTVRATRGAALVMLGRPGGRALLERDLDEDGPTYDRTLRRVFIARALLDEGDRAGAEAMLAGTDLVPLGPRAEFPLLEELRAALAAAPEIGRAEESR